MHILVGIAVLIVWVLVHLVLMLMAKLLEKMYLKTNSALELVKLYEKQISLFCHISII